MDKQAISGVAPPEMSEVSIMTVFPSMAESTLGQMLGRGYALGSGRSAFYVGKLVMLLAIPVALTLYLFRLLPWNLTRYRLTNRRVIVERGLRGMVVRSIRLDEFDAIDVEVLPGQAFYPAGELIFRRGPVQTLRLSGVLRPETFRRTCLKAQISFEGVRRARGA